MSQSRPPHDGGSTALGDKEPRKGRGLWWLWLLAAVVAVVVLLLLLSRCGGDDSDSGGTAATPTDSPSAAQTASSPPAAGTAPSAGTVPSASTAQSGAVSPSSATSASTPTSPGASAGSSSGGAGVLTAGGTSLLPLATAAPQGTLSAYDGMPAVGMGVTVLSVPADEGFWVGTSDSDRVWVQLTGSGESPYHVKAGDRVDLNGTVVPHSKGFAAKVGVTTPEGAAMLTSEMAHIKVAQGAVTLSTS